MIETRYVWHVNFDKPKRVHEHGHNYYEIVYYLKGEGEVDYYTHLKFHGNEESKIDYVDDPINATPKESFPFKNNVLIFMPPKVVHAEEHRIPGTVVDIGFKMLDEECPLGPTLYQDDSFEIHRLIERVWSEFKEKRPHYEEYIAALIREILITLVRESSEAPSKTDPIRFARNYIKENFATDIDMDNLASITGYGPEHFRFLFKKETGVSPKAYMLKKRFDYACKLLETTNYSIKTIASLCGYEDFSQFSILFKKKVGVSARTYRKNAAQTI